MIKFQLVVQLVFLSKAQDQLLTCFTVYSSQDEPSLNAPCNADCGCSSSDGFSPICGADGVTYFSPCYAACSVDVDENKVVFVMLYETDPTCTEVIQDNGDIVS